jgi:hypothetical protein
VLEHPNCTRRFEPGFSVLQENIGFKLHRVQMQVPVQSLTDRGLRRHESKGRMSIMAEDKPSKSRTENTMAVKDDYWTVIGKDGNRWVLPIAICPLSVFLPRVFHRERWSMSIFALVGKLWGAVVTLPLSSLPRPPKGSLVAPR